MACDASEREGFGQYPPLSLTPNKPRAGLHVGEIEFDVELLRKGCDFGICEARRQTAERVKLCDMAEVDNTGVCRVFMPF